MNERLADQRAFFVYIFDNQSYGSASDCLSGIEGVEY